MDVAGEISLICCYRDVRRPRPLVFPPQRGRLKNRTLRRAETCVLRLSDGTALADAYVRNRACLSRWEPVRPEEYYSEAWQVADIASRLDVKEAGEGYPFGLFAGDNLVGRFNVAGIVCAPSRARVLATGWVAHSRVAGWRQLPSRRSSKRRATKSDCAAWSTLLRNVSS